MTTDLSWWDFNDGRRILYGESTRDPYFSSLLTAVCLKADPDNFAALASAFPEFVAIVRRRQNAPNGILPSDPIEHILDELDVSADDRPAIRRLVTVAPS